MNFAKMQGCGNDYVYIWLDESVIANERTPECIRALWNGVPDDINPELRTLVTTLSNRNFGVGADGVIFIRRFPTIIADFEMMMYNADGSRGKMCGNGMRCVAKYVRDHRLTGKDSFDIVSCRVPHTVRVNAPLSEPVESVTVNMGAPVLTLEDIPVQIPSAVVEAAFCAVTPRPPHLIYCPLELGDMVYFFTPVSMGNPHAVVFLPPETDLDAFDVAGVGSRFARHAYFPESVNVEFAIVDSSASIRMRVWERGSGETLCCGTGCCAVAVAGMLTGMTGETVTVHTRGGDVECTWKYADNVVCMTGPAVTVFEGELFL